MKLTKSETNNAIITTLANVRPHPNADRLKLATVLGTQIIVGLDASEGDPVVYFDSNLRLSHEYLYWNNLYSSAEMNSNKEVKGYFGKNGRVRAQKFRGEVSNGFVMPVQSLAIPGVVEEFPSLEVGDEFTHINDVEICSKYFVEPEGGEHIVTGKRKRKSRISTDMFWKMCDMEHLMRHLDDIAPGVVYVEEKIHGTSGRTANVLCRKRKRWFQFWKPRYTSFWRVMSGTRRVDGIRGHMKIERAVIHDRLAPHVHKGEELYYEIYGYDLDGKMIQRGFPYGCVYHREKAWDNPGGLPDPFKVMLYRVTITTEDGYRVDLDREQVYRRAEELGLEKPVLLLRTGFSSPENITVGMYSSIVDLANGQSALDPYTLREGIVVWFKNSSGNWGCLKHKSEEFLLREDKNRDEGIGDVEDNL